MATTFTMTRGALKNGQAHHTTASGVFLVAEVSPYSKKVRFSVRKNMRTSYININEATQLLKEQTK